MSQPAVLITGAATRIGHAIAERFSAGGWHVVIHYHQNRAEAESLAETMDPCELIGFDLADTERALAAVDDLAARLPDWRALICNASLFIPDWPEQPDAASWDRIEAVNLRGNIQLAARFLARAKSEVGRRLVNLLDQKLANLNPDFFSYTVSKAGLAAAGQMLALAREGSADRVYGLAPGLTLPSHDQTEAEFAQSASMNLLRRINQPSDIAEAAWFLVTGPVANGTTLLVDSGQHLVRQKRDVMYLVRQAG